MALDVQLVKSPIDCPPILYTVVPKSVTAHPLEGNARISDLTRREIQGLARVEKSN